MDVIVIPDCFIVRMCGTCNTEHAPIRDCKVAK